MTISYAGLTITAEQDGIDDLYSDDQNGDVGISGSMGGLSFAVVAETDRRRKFNFVLLVWRYWRHDMGFCIH